MIGAILFLIVAQYAMEKQRMISLGITGSRASINAGVDVMLLVVAGFCSQWGLSLLLDLVGV